MTSEHLSRFFDKPSDATPSSPVVPVMPCESFSLRRSYFRIIVHSCHVSLSFFSVEQFLRLSLFSWPWHWWGLQASYFIESPSIGLSWSDVSPWYGPHCASLAATSPLLLTAFHHCKLGVQSQFVPSPAMFLMMIFCGVIGQASLTSSCPLSSLCNFLGSYLETM